MLILWILIGSALLFLLQRVIYVNHWDDKLGISFRFSNRAITEGESADLFVRSENNKLLTLPTFGYIYTVIRNFSAPPQTSDFSMTQIEHKQFKIK